MADKLPCDDLKHRVLELEAALRQSQQAMEVLGESEKKHRLFVESASEGIWAMDKDRKTTFVNRSMAQMLGYTQEEMLGKPVEFFMHEEELADHQKKMQDRKQGRAGVYERCFRRKDGGLVWTRVSANAIVDPQGMFAGSHAFFTDITHSKNAQKALRDSEEKYRVTFEAITDSLTVTRVEDGRYLYVNDGFCSQTGYSREEVLGRRPSDINLYVYPDDRVRFISILKRDGQARDVLVTFRRKNGQTYVSEFSAKPILFGGESCLLAQSRDITERTKAEQALVESEKRLRTYVDHAPEGIFIADAQGRYLEVNNAACAITGYSQEELLGMAFSDLPAPGSLETGRRHFEQVKSKGRAKGEIEFVKKDGSSCHVFVDAVALSQDRFMAFCSDITERIRAEKEKAQLATQLQQALKIEAIGRLAGGVAHDFNNMLTVILGHAEMAMEGVAPDQQLYNDLSEIHKAAQRSAELTRQLLAFARKQTAEPRMVDLNDALNGMLGMVRRLIGENVVLSWMPGPSLWPVKMDPAQLNQMLVNLCVNARDAIQGVGRIVIKTANAEFDPAYCRTRPGFMPGEYVALTVSDDGRGMSQEELASIFEPFFTTKELGKGTGLGLATVYGIVKQNKGFISVHSEPGHGAVFTIHLPRCECGAMETPAHIHPEEPRAGGKTILLVEDEPGILSLGRIILERLNYTVITAGTPGLAIHLAGEHTGGIDLLITDVIMPEMNGRDLANRLLTLHPKMRRLFMSGYTADVIAHHGVLEEGVHFIQKPFTRDALAAKVRQVMEEASACGAAAEKPPP